MTSVTIMLAIITLNTKLQEVDVLAFKDMKTCTQSIEAIKKEVLKVAQKVEIACIERPLYDIKSN